MTGFDVYLPSIHYGWSGDIIRVTENFDPSTVGQGLFQTDDFKESRQEKVKDVDIRDSDALEWYKDTVKKEEEK